MIFQYREAIRHQTELKIPVKFIHTTSNDLIADVIRSTNRQTPVPDEAFVALERFHKRLQSYYREFPAEAKDRLFYERRSKEYLSANEVTERSRIINLHAQIRCFVSVMIGDPQLVMSNNPSTILRDHEGRLFADDHKYAPYFTSAYMLFRLQSLIASGRLDGGYSYPKYWVAWIARIAALGRVNVGAFNSASVETQCEDLVRRLSDDSNAVRIFDAAGDVFLDCRRRFVREQNVRVGEVVRLRQFRDFVRQFIAEEIERARPRVV